MADNRRITLTTLPDSVAKSHGLHIGAVTQLLGLWTSGLTDDQLHERFILWSDRNKFLISPVWYRNVRHRLIFKKGYSVTEQIDNEINRLAGDGNDDVQLDIRELTNLPFRTDNQTDTDVLRTVCHNLNTSRLPTNEDSTYWTQWTTSDTENGYSSFSMPILPSTIPSIYKSGFDPNTHGQQ